MIAYILSPAAKEYLTANRARLEAETTAWLDRDLEGPCPTSEIEQMLLAELVECLGVSLVRPMIECIAPKGGWPAAETGAA